MTPEASFVAPGISGRGRSSAALALESLRRPGGRRALSALAAVLLFAGLALIAYPLMTNIYQGIVQSHLKSTFRGDPKIATEYKNQSVPVGDGLTELKIPSIGVDVLVVQGTTPSALRAGAGHYVGTPLPGEAGNVGIAGHRTTFGRPFNRLDEVKVGQYATLQTPFAIYTYQVVDPSEFPGPQGQAPANPHPVLPEDVSVLDQPGTTTESAAAVRTNQHLLTLTTCNPKGSAAQRLILRLKEVKAEALPGKVLPAGTEPTDFGTPALTSVSGVDGGD